MVDRPALRQKCVKFASRAAAVEKRIPITARAASEPVFVTVKMFCTIAPMRRPRELSQVRKTMDEIASRFCVFRPTLYGPRVPNQRCHGPMVPAFQIQPLAENHGTITPVNFANEIATAAIVAVWITSSMVQP